MVIAIYKVAVSGEDSMPYVQKVYFILLIIYMTKM